MKKILLTGIVLLLSGCNLTPPETLSDKQDSQPVVASEPLDGVVKVEHPVEPVEVPLPVEEKIEPITDVWTRIQQQLSLDIPEQKRIEQQKRWYLKNPQYMKRVTKRATPFLYFIVEEIEKRNMPLDLALLPIVESAFDPFAYSHEKAAGMWQFVPWTGRHYGLKQNWWYDGRRDVAEATRAALDYLEALNKMFDGNWLHAVAAYNSGEGRVLNAIKKNKRRGKPTDFWSLKLPKETSAYVPKLLALADILSQRDQHAVVWEPIENKPVIAKVDAGSQIDLAFAAELAGMTVKELHALNPGYNRWATDPEGPHTLLLPIDKKEDFILALNETEDKQRLNWVRHKIKSGDSLIKLAKHYHTTTDVIRKVNDVRGNMIRSGDFLLIPVALRSLDAYSLSQDQRMIARQTQKKGSYQLTHEVKPGDTFWDISREYGVKISSLARWNNMAPKDTLKPGQKLVLWLNKVSPKQSENAVMRSLTYNVRRGDSLARIANKFSITVSDLVRWNQLDKKKYLQPGQKLKVYVDVTRT